MLFRPREHNAFKELIAAGGMQTAREVQAERKKRVRTRNTPPNILCTLYDQQQKSRLLECMKMLIHTIVEPIGLPSNVIIGNPVSRQTSCFLGVGLCCLGHEDVDAEYLVNSEISVEALSIARLLIAVVEESHFRTNLDARVDTLNLTNRALEQKHCDVGHTMSGIYIYICIYRICILR